MMMYGGGGGGFWHINFSQPPDRPRVTRDILARILGMLVPYWREGGIVLVCLAAAAAVGLAPPLMIRALIDDALALLFKLHWLLAVLAVGALPLFILPTRKVGRIRHDIARDTSKRYAELTAFMEETLSISGYLLMKTFTRDTTQLDKFRAKNKE